MRDDKDRSGKWMIGHCGGGLLRLAGVHGFTTWRAASAEVIQPRQLPDGLLEVFFPRRSVADPFLMEIATYPERRADEQALRDALLVWLDRRVLPDVVTIVLRPRGQLRITGRHHFTSRHGFTEFSFAWRVVELWTVPAEELLAANDVGLIPWLPLTQFARAGQKGVVMVLESRFGRLSKKLIAAVSRVNDPEAVTKLMALALSCSALKAFQSAVAALEHN